MDKLKIQQEQIMIEDAMVIIAGDMFQKIYDLEDLGWVYVTQLIKLWAKKFVDELQWKGDDDERDWLIELENFEEREFEKLRESVKNNYI